MTFKGRRWRLAMLSRPPLVTDGVLRVLYVLGPDHDPMIWAHLLGADVEEVERALVWLVRERKGRRATLQALFRLNP